jgi:hypothetical protein
MASKALFLLAILAAAAVLATAAAEQTRASLLDSYFFLSSFHYTRARDMMTLSHIYTYANR